jgi:NADPH-dependent F420 reductase
MHIGIIGGTGAEGRGLATRLAAAGVHTLVGSRDLDRAREVVTGLANQNRSLPLEAATNESVIDTCDVTFLAVPFARAADVVASHRAAFRPGALVVDLTVPVSFPEGRPVMESLPEGSAAEHLRARLPAEVKLAATLKTIPAAVLTRIDTPLDCDEFVCGDSPEARTTTIEVLGRIPGLRLVDVGGLETAGILERMTLLAIAINKRYRVRTARFRVVGVNV